MVEGQPFGLESAHACIVTGNKIAEVNSVLETAIADPAVDQH
jgi:hypothetical protein